MCGVFGIRSVERDVARLSYFALFALQHRGQESAGIAVSEGGRLTVLRDMGLVAQVFNEQQLQALPGRGRDRPHALLDDGGRALVERAAARPSRPGAHRRARPQRQPDECGRAARRARRGRDPARLDLGHRGDRRADRARSGAACPRRWPPRCAASRARTRSSRSSTARSSPSATRTASGRSRSAASATTGSSPPRAAPST